MNKFIFFIILGMGIMSGPLVNGAAFHIIDGINTENPAALNRVKHCEIILGDTYVNPKLKFKGTSFGERGTAISSPHDHLPYGQAAYRFCDKFVYGLAYFEYKYTNIIWGNDSVLRFVSTQTKINAFKIANRISYKLTEKLALGFAIDIMYQYNTQINFDMPDLGVIKNKSKSPHVWLGFDFGFFYAINEHTFLNVAAFLDKRSKKTSGRSTSQSGLSNDRYYWNVLDPSDYYVQLISTINEKLLVAIKANFSNFNVQTSVNLHNTVVGNIKVPTHWHNVWTFEGYAQYKVCDQWTVFAAAQYNTNYATRKLNNPAYPGSPVPVGAVGFIRQINDCLALRLNYAYMCFAPKAKIDFDNTKGKISLNNNIFDLRLTYAW